MFLTFLQEFAMIWTTFVKIARSKIWNFTIFLMPTLSMKKSKDILLIRLNADIVCPGMTMTDFYVYMKYSKYNKWFIRSLKKTSFFMFILLTYLTIRQKNRVALLYENNVRRFPWPANHSQNTLQTLLSLRNHICHLLIRIKSKQEYPIQ